MSKEFFTRDEFITLSFAGMLLIEYLTQTKISQVIHSSAIIAVATMLKRSVRNQLIRN